MQTNISTTMFYSLLFAMGGAPTLAMMIIQSQPHDPEMMYQILIGLSVMLACVLVPIILLQNAYLFFKRHNAVLDEKIKPLSKVYLALNAICLLYWIGIQLFA